MLKSIEITRIFANPYQPKSRLEPNAETLNKMVESIRQHGILQTPVVRLQRPTDTRFEIADGWLRFSAWTRLYKEGSELRDKYTTIECDVRELTDLQMADMVMEANTVRQDLNPIEEAGLYKRFVDEFHIPQDELASRHHCSQGEISNTMRLLDLPEVVQHRIIENGLKPTHARALLPLKDPLQQTLLADEILTKGMTVEAVENKVRELLGREKKEKPQEVTRSEEELMAEVRKLGGEHVIDANLIRDRLKVGYPLAARLFDKWCAEQAPLPPPTVPSTDNDAQAEPPDSNTDAHPRRESSKVPVKKAEPPKPVAPVTHAPPSPPAILPKWRRKLVLEEAGEYTTVSYMEEGQMPSIKRVAGNLEAALASFLSQKTKEVK